MPVLPLIAALLLLSLPVAAPAQADAEPSPEQLAAEALAHAELLVAKGSHAAALKEYRITARKWPDTEAGRVAEERTRPTTFFGWSDILRHGPSANRVDVVVMGDGYDIKKQGEFDDIAKTLPRLFDHNKTLGEYQRHFNFLRANLISAENGIDGLGREYDTALGGFIRGTIQGHVGVDRRLVRQMLEFVPEHDGFAVVYVKRGEHGTGGGGVAVIGGRNDPTTIHEWGHAFANLGDEYTTTTHERGDVAQRPNISDTDDPERVPWKHWLEADVKGLGIYEGADGRVKGAWKARAASCLMEHGQFFCYVCREAVVLRIHEFVDPIDAWTPQPGGAWLDSGRDDGAALVVEPGPWVFAVRVMQPMTHDLEVRWWVLPAAEAPAEPTPGARATGTRLDRGPLASLDVEPTNRSRGDNSGVHEFELDPADLEPGRYVVLCRAWDDTDVKGDRYPWVLRDASGLLQSERRWHLQVR